MLGRGGIRGIIRRIVVAIGSVIGSIGVVVVGVIII